MDEYEFKRDVETRLLQLPHAHRINQNQIACRCMLCGDSKKDPRKTRFYVQINANNDKPIVYNCFNCNASGILTPEILRTFDINDLNLNSNLVSFNRGISRRYNKIYNIKDNKFNYRVPIGRKGTSDEIKKKYIEKRLGREFTFEELQKMKVVFNLKEFLLYNHIENLTVDIDRGNRINTYYVGFLSVRNEYIIFRDITGKNKLRYDKYTIVQNIDNTRKFYTIPNKIDVLTTKPVYINLAEGAFDILGVYYHIREEHTKNQIYAAVSGAAYTSVIKYFISSGLIGDNVIVNIYSDSDKDIYWYRKTIEELSIFVKEINIFYNRISKDYGVPKENIDLMKVKNK